MLEINMIMFPMKNVQEKMFLSIFKYVQYVKNKLLYCVIIVTQCDIVIQNAKKKIGWLISPFAENLLKEKLKNEL